MKFLASLASWKRDSPAPPPVPEYQLDCPVVEDLGRYLVLAVGADEAARIWSRACAEVGVGPEQVMDLPTLQKIAARIENGGGPAGTIAAAFGIRARSYLFLTTSPSQSREES